MGHCGGGDGTSTFNMISALEQWAEDGKALDWIPASRVSNGAVDPHTSPVPVATGGGIQGFGQRGRRGKFCVSRTITGFPVH